MGGVFLDGGVSGGVADAVVFLYPSLTPNTQHIPWAVTISLYANNSIVLQTPVTFQLRNSVGQTKVPGSSYS